MPVARGDRITSAGFGWLQEIGLALNAAGAHDERYAIPCCNWSEPREHLAGCLAAALTGARRAVAGAKRPSAMRASPRPSTRSQLCASSATPTPGGPLLSQFGGSGRVGTHLMREGESEILMPACLRWYAPYARNHGSQRANGRCVLGRDGIPRAERLMTRSAHNSRER